MPLSLFLFLLFVRHILQCLSPSFSFLSFHNYYDFLSIFSLLLFWHFDFMFSLSLSFLFRYFSHLFHPHFPLLCTFLFHFLLRFLWIILFSLLLFYSLVLIIFSLLPIFDSLPHPCIQTRTILPFSPVRSESRTNILFAI